MILVIDVACCATKRKGHDRSWHIASIPEMLGMAAIEG
jgi:hypothetical protein